MSEDTFTLACLVLGMTLVTALPRIPPILLLSGRRLPALLVTWLGFVPVAILAALLAPDLLLVRGNFDVTWDNLFFWAALPTILVVWKTGSFMAALCVGMGVLAVLRQCVL